MKSVVLIENTLKTNDQNDIMLATWPYKVQFNHVLVDNYL